MIEIENLTVAFGQVRPLDALDAKLSAPIVGLIGPNGAGKTTLLNVLSGFVTPVSGRISMDGRALLGVSPVRRVRMGLRRAFQQELVVLELTAEENVRAAADHVSSSSTVDEDVERAIGFVGLAAMRHKLGRRLSLFERRMVEIARMLVGAPKVILLDEPGAGLNDAETQMLHKVLVSIPDTYNAQLILIDHDADLIASICQETMVLDFGRRLAIGATPDVLNDPGVRRAYLGDT